jgi:hypothetical protein
MKIIAKQLSQDYPISVCFSAWRKIHGGSRKKNWNQIPYMHCSWMKDLGVFVDFASSTGNQGSCLWKKNRCPVSGNEFAAMPCSNPTCLGDFSSWWTIRCSNLFSLFLHWYNYQHHTRNQILVLALLLGHWPPAVALVTWSGHCD